MGEPIVIRASTSAIDWTQDTLVYQVLRDGVWVDQTDEQYFNRPLAEHQVWRQRLVRGVEAQEGRDG